MTLNIIYILIKSNVVVAECPSQHKFWVLHVTYATDPFCILAKYFTISLNSLFGGGGDLMHRVILDALYSVSR